MTSIGTIFTKQIYQNSSVIIDGIYFNVKFNYRRALNRR